MAALDQEPEEIHTHRIENIDILNTMRVNEIFLKFLNYFKF